MTDDGVPATTAWVRAIPEPQQSLIPSWQYGGTRTVRTLRVYIRVGVGELILTNPTRGQIRRVFADIGVPLPAVEQPVAVVSDSDRGRRRPTGSRGRGCEVLTFGSLFSGIGGMDLGLERAGLRCVWQVEINDFCRRVLAKHWPGVRRHDDVRTFPPPGNRDWSCDVIAGGFPCKQTSAAAAVHGRRVGLAGSDSGLWREYARVVDRLRPRLVVVENPDSKWLTEVSGDLAGLGYKVQLWPCSAVGVGAPHLRRRVFVVAHFDGAGLAIPGPTRPPEAVAQAWGASARDVWLSAFPGVLRVGDGLPGGLDRRERITALGNAVVPQVAEWIGRRLLAAHGEG